MASSSSLLLVIGRLSKAVSINSHRLTTSEVPSDWKGEGEN